MQLHLQDLVELTGGEVRLAAMPPLAGILTPISRVLFKAAAIEVGDLYWCLTANRCDVELAFIRGAIGVVCSSRAVHPWPRRFVVVVDDAVHALERLVEGLSRQLALSSGEEFRLEASELKDLQLCAAQRVDNSPPTCERSIRSRQANCRRQAA